MGNATGIDEPAHDVGGGLVAGTDEALEIIRQSILICSDSSTSCLGRSRCRDRPRGDQEPRWTRSPGPSGYGLHRLITALGHCTVVAPGDRGMTLMSSCLILILCGRLHRPNVFQDASKIRLRREAHGSISVQEGQPRIFPICLVFWFRQMLE